MVPNHPAASIRTSRRSRFLSVLRSGVRIGLTLGTLGAVAFALTRLARPRPATASGWSATAPTWPPLRPWLPSEGRPAAATTALRPDPDAPRATLAESPRPTEESTIVWVEATGGVCPVSHPVKAKLTSKIFHLPGMGNYERTNPDRCYPDAGSAEADGLRQAKR